MPRPNSAQKAWQSVRCVGRLLDGSCLVAHEMKMGGLVLVGFFNHEFLERFSVF